MAVYFITGKLGAGKSVSGVGKIHQYLKEGRRVATNLDLFLENMLPSNDKQTVIRLPDKPRASDLYEIGTGDGRPYDEKESYNESKFGLLVLDECATWLNTREYRDKERPEFIQYLLHARKYRWDILFFVQEKNTVDKQILDSLCEHWVVCKRLDRVTIPFLSFFIKIFTRKKMTLPKVHLAIVRYGASERSPIVERWVYRGNQYYSCYNTGQVFMNDVLYYQDDMIDMRASYCMLSAWHLKGRYLPSKKQIIIEHLNYYINSFLRKLQGRPPATPVAKAGPDIYKNYLQRIKHKKRAPVLRLVREDYLKFKAASLRKT